MEIKRPIIEIAPNGDHIKYKYPDGETIDVRYTQVQPRPSSQDTVNVMGINAYGQSYESSHNRTGRNLNWYMEYADKYPRAVLERIKTARGVVLDIASGQGQYVEDLRTLSVEAYGLDAWLDDKQRALDYYLLGFAHRTGLVSNWAQIVTVNNVMHYSMTDAYRRAVLQELTRLTKVSGSILIYPLSRQEKHNFSQLVEGLSVNVVNNGNHVSSEQKCSELWEIVKTAS